MQRADDLDERLQRSLAQRLAQLRGHCNGLRQRLFWRHPKSRIAESAATVRILLENAKRMMDAQLRQDQERVEALARTLGAVSPLNALERGFAIVTRASGEAITRSEQSPLNQAIEVNFHDGAIEALAKRRHPLPQRWRTPAEDLQ